MAGKKDGDLPEKVKQEALAYLKQQSWYKDTPLALKPLAEQRYYKRLTVEGYNRLNASLMAQEYMEGYRANKPQRT